MTDFTLTTDPANRVSVLDTLHNTLDDLPLDKPWDIVISPADEGRRAKQNRLLWCWNRDWANHNGEPVGWAHGSTKLDWLLPIKLASTSVKTRKRAEFEASVLAHVPMREHKIGAAYDLVRSNDIPMHEFAAYLSEYQRSAGVEGCVLTAKKRDLDEVLMREMESRAA